MYSKVWVIGGLLIALIVPPSASGATPPVRHDRFPLHIGSSGPRVKGLKWMLQGHKPAAYKIIAYPPKIKIDGYYGERLGLSVKKVKYILGFPQKRVNKAAGREFWDIYQGKKPRPLSWILRASSRKKTADKAAAEEAYNRTWTARLIKLEKSQIACCSLETWGINWGPKVKEYQSSTGAYKAAWCVSFQQWVLMTSGYGRIADKSAGVAYVTGWAQKRGWVRSRAAPGRLVAWLPGIHMAMVTEVTSKGYWTVEGNSSNSVRRLFHPYGQWVAFISLPNVS